MGLRWEPRFDSFGDFAEFSTWQYETIRDFANGARPIALSIRWDNSQTKDWQINLSTGAIDPTRDTALVGPDYVPTLRWQWMDSNTSRNLVEIDSDKTLLSIPKRFDAKNVEIYPIRVFRSDGKVIAIFDRADNSCFLWRVGEQAPFARLNGVTYYFAFSPDLSLFVARSQIDKCFKVFDGGTGEWLGQIPANSNYFRIGRNNIMIVQNKQMRNEIEYDVWQLPVGELLGTVKVTFQQHKDTSRAQHFSADGRVAFFDGSTNGSVWDLASRPPRNLDHHFAVPNEQYEFASAGPTLMVFYRMANRWRIIDTTTGQVIAEKQLGSDCKCGYPAVSPDGRYYLMSHQCPTTVQTIRDQARRWLNIGPSNHYLQFFEIVDSLTGAVKRQLPTWKSDHWNVDATEFWTSDTILDFSNKPAGVAFRKWSIHPPGVPWWLWTLTAGVIVSMIYEIRQRQPQCERRAVP